jgi:cytoskeleton protein RodZ
MSLSKRIGTLLRDARESKKLTIQEVGREINMIPKFIDALEKEDYSLFPSETYTLGFLRSYSEFLGLDTDEVISLYRGVQIDQTQTPVKELTKPISGGDFVSSLDLGQYKKQG